MIDKTVLELVDRLVATSNRTAIAEEKARQLDAINVQVRLELAEANKQIEELKAQIEDLKNDIEIKDDTICRQYAAKEKLKERIKELEKDDTEGS